MQYENPPTYPSDVRDTSAAHGRGSLCQQAADVTCAPFKYVKDTTMGTPRRRRNTKRSAIGAAAVIGATAFSVGMYEWSKAADKQSPPPLSVCGPASATVNQTAHDRNLFPGQNGTVGCMATSHRAWPGDNSTGSAFWSEQTPDTDGKFYLTYDESALEGAARYQDNTGGWKHDAFLHSPSQQFTRVQTLQAPNDETAHEEEDVAYDYPAQR